MRSLLTIPSFTLSPPQSHLSLSSKSSNTNSIEWKCSYFLYTGTLVQRPWGGSRDLLGSVHSLDYGVFEEPFRRTKTTLPQPRHYWDPFPFITSTSRNIWRPITSLILYPPKQFKLLPLSTLLSLTISLLSYDLNQNDHCTGTLTDTTIL